MDLSASPRCLQPTMSPDSWTAMLSTGNRSWAGRQSISGRVAEHSHEHRVQAMKETQLVRE
jgi:hypothetical protein